MAQKCFAHGPGAITSCSPTSIRPWLVSTRARGAVGVELERAHLDAAHDLDALLGALAREAVHGFAVEGEPALVLVQAAR